VSPARRLSTPKWLNQGKPPPLLDDCSEFHSLVGYEE
jgi:hypothetical protein